MIIYLQEKVLGITDNLPDEAVSMGEADNCRGVVLIGFGNIDEHPIVNPVHPLDVIGHTTKEL
jgi:hypothetical protein